MRWVLILVLAALPWVRFRQLVVQSRRRVAALLVAGWFLALAMALAFLESRFPGTCGRLFPGAQAYAEGMLEWVRTGSGCEGTPSCFLPQHLMHLALFLGLTWATGGFGGMAMATVLFGWMGAYTGKLAVLAESPWAFVAGWHPWAVLRVVGFVLLGVAFSEPLLGGGLSALRKSQRWWLPGFAFCLADLLVKWFCAEAFRVSVLQPLCR